MKNLKNKIHIDKCGVAWEPTGIIDPKSVKKENEYYRPLSCFCDKEYDDSGYTYQDEYGNCDFCEGLIRTIFGHNLPIKDPIERK